MATQERVKEWGTERASETGLYPRGFGCRAERAVSVGATYSIFTLFRQRVSGQNFVGNIRFALTLI